MEISNKNQTVKVGVVSLIVLALFLVLFIFYVVGSYQELFNPTKSYYIFLSNVQGLEPGSFVTIAGMKAGVVGFLKMGRIGQQPGIRVELKIQDKYSGLVRKTSFAEVKTMGVLGNKYVDISLGNAGDSTMAAGSYLPTKASINLEDIGKRASMVVDQLDSMINDVRNGKGTLGMLIGNPEMAENIKRIVDEVGFITARISRGEGNAGRLLNDTLMFHNFNRTVDNLNKISSRIQNGEGSLGKLVADTTFYSRILVVSARMDQVLQKLDSRQGTAGEMLNNRELYEKLINVTSSLHELAEDIRKNPKKYVHLSLF